MNKSCFGCKTVFRKWVQIFQSCKKDPKVCLGCKSCSWRKMDATVASGIKVSLGAKRKKIVKLFGVKKTGFEKKRCFGRQTIFREKLPWVQKVALFSENGCNKLQIFIGCKSCFRCKSFKQKKQKKQILKMGPKLDAKSCFGWKNGCKSCFYC